MNDQNDQVATTYKYAVRGPIQPSVDAEIGRGHRHKNQLVEYEHTYEADKAQAWEEDPVVAPVLAAVAAAEEADVLARAVLGKARQDAGLAVKRGDKAGAAAAKQRAAVLREEAAEAKRVLIDAREQLRAVKGERWPQAQRAIAAAREARDKAIGDTYGAARDAGMFWATWADITEHHRVSVRRVGQRRSEGGPAQMRFRRYDGTGTVTVQIQRELGVSAGDRALVAALKAAGLEAGQVSELVAAGVPAADASAGRVAALRAAGLAPGEVTRALIAGMDSEAAAWVTALAAEAERAWETARDKATAARVCAAAAPKSEAAALRKEAARLRAEAAAAKKKMIADRAAALREALDEAAALTGERVPGRSWTAQTISRMREEGPEKAGDPPCTAEVLASGEGKWRDQFRLSPELPEDFADLPRGERRRLARTGRLAIRTGAGDAAAVTEMPVTVHRPMAPGAEVKFARLTVTRCGPEREQHLTLAAKVALPPRKPGRLVAVHTGWRVLPDRALRVAVCTGAGPIPAGVVATGTVRDRGGWQEVVIPPAWRDEQAGTEKRRALRDLAFNTALEETAVWLETHPGAGETLPTGPQVRQWRSPGRLAALGRQVAAGEHGDAAGPLGDLIAGWERGDRGAWRNEARGRRRLTRRRDDAWRKIAAWLCAGAGEIRVDEWEMPVLARKPGMLADDDPQAAAARGNRVLAAPGELRAAVRNAARLLNVAVTGRAAQEDDEDQAAAGAPPQVHWVCGTVLGAEARRKGILVRCGCGALVDQDQNMLELMLG